MITVLATIVLLIHTQPIDLLAGIAAKTTVSAYPYALQLQMVVAASAALVALLVLTALSVYKPRGMTRYEQRKQNEQRQGVAVIDAANDKAQGIVQECEGSEIHATTFQ